MQVLFALNPVLPNPLPQRVQELTAEHGHHLLVTVGDFGAEEIQRFHDRLEEFSSANPVAVHSCDVRRPPLAAPNTSPGGAN